MALGDALGGTGPPEDDVTVETVHDNGAAPTPHASNADGVMAGELEAGEDERKGDEAPPGAPVPPSRSQAQPRSVGTEAGRATGYGRDVVPASDVPGVVTGDAPLATNHRHRRAAEEQTTLRDVVGGAAAAANEA